MSDEETNAPAEPETADEAQAAPETEVAAETPPAAPDAPSADAEEAPVAVAPVAPVAPVATDANPADPNARGLKKTRVGVVVSDSMSKTIVVKVTRRVPHPQFKKIVKRSSTFYAHDETGEAKTGDKVRIVESRPISKKKRWRLLDVLAH